MVASGIRSTTVVPVAALVISQVPPMVVIRLCMFSSPVPSDVPDVNPLPSSLTVMASTPLSARIRSHFPGVRVFRGVVEGLLGR